MLLTAHPDGAGQCPGGISMQVDAIQVCEPE